MVKFAVFRGETILTHFTLRNDQTSTTLDNVQKHLQPLGTHNISAVAIASVGPTSDTLVNELSKLAPDATLQLHAGLDLGIVNAYEQPTRVGIDRLLNVLAAHTLYGGPAVIADVGTATNFECVGANGEFLGGAICAGPQLSLDALSSRSKQLLHVVFDKPSALIATNTSDALRSGAYYGHAHLVDGLLRQFRGVLGPDTKTMITGGYAEQLFPLLTNATHLAPALTLHGVRLAWERFKKPPSNG